jgi:hypothetical protein
MSKQHLPLLPFAVASSCRCFWVSQAFKLGIYTGAGEKGLSAPWVCTSPPADSQNGKPRNKSQKVGMFLVAKNRHTAHHKNHAFHHKLTTISPRLNTTKSQNPQQKPPFSFPKYFLQNDPSPHLFAIKADRESRTPHAASEVVLPYLAPRT